MSPPPRHNEQGFTLVELLVVILVIGILAAIAVPAFLNQRVKGMDANAKSLARNMVSQIEACYHASGGFLGCDAELTTASTGLPVGAGPGEVRLTRVEVNGYEIVATSEAQTNGTHHTFTITHNIGGVFDHDCDVKGEGGCPVDGDW